MGLPRPVVPERGGACLLYLTFGVCSSLLLYTISGALVLIDFDSTGVDWYVFFRVSFHMNLLGGLLSRVVDLLLVMTLVEVGNGLLFCHTESRTVLQRVVRYAAIVLCAILAVVALVGFGIMNALVALSSSPEDKLWKAYEKLYASSSILLFIWAGILVGLSAHVYNEVKRNRVLRNVSCPWLLQHRLKPVQGIPCAYSGMILLTQPSPQSAMLFLCAAVLNLVTCLYSLVYASVFLLAGVRIHFPSKTYTAILIAGPILTEWVYAAIVAILVTIAVRKHNGLWSTVQPWLGTEEESHPVLVADPSSTGEDEQLPEESSIAVPN